MLERNKIYCIDVLDGLKQLDNDSVDVIITSPPYNNGGVHSKSNWKQNKGGINDKWSVVCYGGDTSTDNMPEDEYEEWQIKILNECYRVLKPDGSMFYNHKNRIWHGKGEIISPYKWLFKTNFKIRQEIIWDRRGSICIHPSRYMQSREQIYWLTKSESPKFVRKKDTPYKLEVWGFQAEKNNEHPAPFPQKLPDNILHCIKENDDDRLLVLDPFMGSGTVALSAKKYGCDYIGFEKFQEYVDMANNRINKNKECLKK